MSYRTTTKNKKKNKKNLNKIMGTHKFSFALCYTRVLLGLCLSSVIGTSVLTSSYNHTISLILSRGLAPYIQNNYSQYLQTNNKYFHTIKVVQEVLNLSNKTKSHYDAAKFYLNKGTKLVQKNKLVLLHFPIATIISKYKKTFTRKENKNK